MKVDATEICAQQREILRNFQRVKFRAWWLFSAVSFELALSETENDQVHVRAELGWPAQIEEWTMERKASSQFRRDLAASAAAELEGTYSLEGEVAPLEAGSWEFRVWDGAHNLTADGHGVWPVQARELCRLLSRYGMPDFWNEEHGTIGFWGNRGVPAKAS